MKTLKALLSWYCYVGTGLVALSEFTGLEIPPELGVSDGAKEVSIALLIVFWVVRTSWFIYDKFHLERKERNLKMDVTRQEINGMKTKNNKEASTATVKASE